ncbi:MAG: hypothetical protein KatS3mg082_0237 [Nitrospiraceae bacterium]|nr:MAG: hypothetical protein KatS3mg082_0237 [Nitrospiraceae bacterium]
MLKELKGRGYELGIVSNFDSRLFNVLRGLGIADLFDTVTISSLARAAKAVVQNFSCRAGQTCGRSGRGASCR